MTIVFKKSCVFNGSKRYVGNVTRVTDSKGLELIEKKIADRYTGVFPPVDKIKTNFFKPK